MEENLQRAEGATLTEEEQKARAFRDDRSTRVEATARSIAEAATREHLSINDLEWAYARAKDMLVVS